MIELDKLLIQHIEHDAERFNAIENKLDALLAAHNKQKGFVAGFAAAFSLIWSVLIGIVAYIWK